MHPILKSENQFVGDWDLNKFGIIAVDIPPSRVQGLVTTTNSSAGVLKKFNVNLKGEDLYIKSGSSTGKLFNIRQPITERIASLIGKLIGLNVVEYKLWVIDRDLFDLVEERQSTQQDNLESSDQTKADPNISFQKALTIEGKVLVSVSKNFLTEESCTFISADQLTKGVAQQDLHPFIVGLSSDIHKLTNDMIMFDYLINNTDRHRKNFGFLQFENQEIVMAPLFDHGLAMFSEFSNDEVEEEGSYLLEYCEGKPFGSLGLAFEKYFDTHLSKGNMNLDVTSEDLYSIINNFEELLGKKRVELIRYLIGKRWEYVRRKILS